MNPSKGARRFLGGTCFQEMWNHGSHWTKADHENLTKLKYKNQYQTTGTFLKEIYKVITLIRSTLDDMD